MTTREFDVTRQELLDYAEGVQIAKRPGYTIGDTDVLRNFKAVGERVGITPGQVLAVYMLKHVDAVTAILCKPDLPVAEAPLGRFADLINYAQLGFALHKESEGFEVEGPYAEDDVCGCVDCICAPDATGYPGEG
jgi:hypothetical protein